MRESTFSFPSDVALEHGLLSMEAFADSGGVHVVSREPNPRTSTHPSEVATCQTGDLKRFRLHCKYSDRNYLDGQRRGAAYEALIYRDVLAVCKSSTAAYVGVFENQDTGVACLVTRHVDNAHGVSNADGDVVRAARWLGRFHQEAEKRADVHAHVAPLEPLSYVGWARRTAGFAASAAVDFGWVPDVCKWYEERLDVLLSATPTIIHGEFYPSNILVSRGTVYPVDWESAALGAGTLDLAALVEGWPPQLVQRCVVAYNASRWPTTTPTEVPDTLPLASIFWHFRWLGENPSWIQGRKRRWRVAQLKRESEHLGVI